MSKTEITINKTELLAPAGSTAALEAALKAGADAVYIGGQKFGARAYADNPAEEELAAAIDQVHILDKKLYMTVNTLLKDREIQKELYSYMRPFYEHGLDGVIVQDLGTASFLRREFPGLALHASTQMAVMGAEAADFLKKQGFSRVVPAREISLEEIENIHRRTGMEIESFVHGAMCYSVSGMCLMSSLIGGRSGNRGRCAGVCRLPFNVYDHGKAINDKNTAYPLNMKDMCALRLLPEMIRSGVISFKIEGRMKRPEYTAGITRIYRKYLDLYEKDPDNYTVDEADMNELSALFNRDGFTSGYYQQKNGREMIALYNEKEREKKNAGRTDDAKKLYDSIRKELHNTPLQRPVRGDLYLTEEGMAVLNVSDDRREEFLVSHCEEIVQRAKNQPLTKERIREQMNKTGNSEFYFRELSVHMPDEDIFVPMKGLNELRREAFEKMRRAITDRYARKAAEEPGQLSCTAEHEYQAGKNSGLIPEVFVLAEEKELLYSLIRRKDSLISGFYVPIHFLYAKGEALNKNTRCEDTDLTDLIIAEKKKLRIVLPYLLRMEHVEECRSAIMRLMENYHGLIDGILVRNLDSVGLLSSMGLEDLIILDSSVYTMNSETRSFWRNCRIYRDTLSHELNFRELKSMDNRNSEMVIYGRTPMMVSAQCLQKTFRGCDHSCAHVSLADRMGAQFPVVCNCVFCYNIIYNSLPLDLTDEKKAVSQLNVKSLRLTFTTENEKTALNVIRRCFEPSDLPKGNYTKEHFRRGVE